MEPRDFESDEQLQQHLTEHADSYDELVIFLSDDVVFTSPKGETVRPTGLGGVLSKCDGSSTAIGRHALEWLLNDGLLNRLSIKIRTRGKGD